MQKVPHCRLRSLGKQFCLQVYLNLNGKDNSWILKPECRHDDLCVVRGLTFLNGSGFILCRMFAIIHRCTSQKVEVYVCWLHIHFSFIPSQQTAGCVGQGHLCVSISQEWTLFHHVSAGLFGLSGVAVVAPAKRFHTGPGAGQNRNVCPPGDSVTPVTPVICDADRCCALGAFTLSRAEFWLETD